MIGYGEDGLTLWALTQRLDDLLRKLDDPGRASEILIFYRPSFGRAGGTGSAPFGEFDAILMTGSKTFLIESKWDGSPLVGNQIVLAEHQILRHRIFRWILVHWAQQRPIDWDSFRRENEKAFRVDFGEKPMAPTGSLLARNLEYTLHRLTNRGMRPPEDVVLFFHREKGRVPGSIASPANDFRLVAISFATLEKSGFFAMS